MSVNRFHSGGIAALGLIITLFPAGCSQQEPATTAPDHSAPFEVAKSEESAKEAESDAVSILEKQRAEARAVAEAIAANKSPEPPDGKWLVGADGREYFIDFFPKGVGKVERLAEDKLRTPWGFVLDLAGEDEDFYQYKVYKPSGVPVPDYIPPTEEEIAAVVATYEVETPTLDRLTFAAFGAGLPDRGRWRNGFELADMNGDGHLDLVHGPPRKGIGGPVILLSDGQGSWKIWQEATFPDGYRYTYGDVAVADWNRDGIMDMAVACHINGTVVMVGDGRGKFTKWTEGVDWDPPYSGHIGGFSSRAIIAVDWNQDELPDLLAMGEGPRLNRTRGDPSSSGGTFGPVLFLNQGDGTWQRYDQGTGWDQIFGDGVAVGDFDGDGRADFASATSMLSRRDIVFRGLPDGTWEAEELELLRPWAYIRDVALGDFTGDGRDDLAVGYVNYELEVWRHGIDVFSRTPEGEWRRHAVVSRDGSQGVYALGKGDLDGDGNLDLVALTGVGETWIFLGDGKGGFVQEESLEIEPDAKRCRGYHVELADLDADGRDEVVTSFSGEPSALFDPTLCTNGGSLRAWDASGIRKGRRGE